MTPRTKTRTEEVTHYGIALRLTIEEDYSDKYGYPDDRTPIRGRVIAAEVLEVVDEVQAYKNLSRLGVA